MTIKHFRDNGEVFDFLTIVKDYEGDLYKNLRDDERFIDYCQKYDINADDLGSRISERIKELEKGYPGHPQFVSGKHILGKNKSYFLTPAGKNVLDNQMYQKEAENNTNVYVHGVLHDIKTDIDEIQTNHYLQNIPGRQAFQLIINSIDSGTTHFPVVDATNTEQQEKEYLKQITGLLFSLTHTQLTEYLQSRMIHQRLQLLKVIFQLNRSFFSDASDFMLEHEIHENESVYHLLFYLLFAVQGNNPSQSKIMTLLHERLQSTEEKHISVITHFVRYVLSLSDGKQLLKNLLDIFPLFNYLSLDIRTWLQQRQYIQLLSLIRDKAYINFLSFEQTFLDNLKTSNPSQQLTNIQSYITTVVMNTPPSDQLLRYLDGLVNQVPLKYLFLLNSIFNSLDIPEAVVFRSQQVLIKRLEQLPFEDLLETFSKLYIIKPGTKSLILQVTDGLDQNVLVTKLQANKARNPVDILSFYNTHFPLIGRELFNLYTYDEYLAIIKHDNQMSNIRPLLNLVKKLDKALASSLFDTTGMLLVETYAQTKTYETLWLLIDYYPLRKEKTQELFLKFFSLNRDNNLIQLFSTFLATAPKIFANIQQQLERIIPSADYYESMMIYPSFLNILDNWSIEFLLDILEYTIINIQINSFEIDVLLAIFSKQQELLSSPKNAVRFGNLIKEYIENKFRPQFFWDELINNLLDLLQQILEPDEFMQIKKTMIFEKLNGLSTLFDFQYM